jgi:alkylation response protein AidB-like acyl-CoA dehydrogenase
MASIELSLTDDQRALRAGVLEICKRYPGEYWRDLDSRREYPDKFVTELTEAGYLRRSSRRSTAARGWAFARAG